MNESDLAFFMQYAKLSKVAGIIVALLCFGIGALGFADSSASLAIQLGLAIPFGIIGLVMLVLTFRPPSMHPAIRALRERSQDIVWVYTMNQSVNNVPSQTFVNLAMSDGKQRALAIGAKTDPTPLLDRLHAVLPHATFGYTPELEAQFKRQPSSLRR